MVAHEDQRNGLGSVPTLARPVACKQFVWSIPMEQGSLPCPSRRVRGPCQWLALSHGGDAAGHDLCSSLRRWVSRSSWTERCWQPPPGKRSPPRGSHPLAVARRKPFAFSWPCLPCGQPWHLGEGVCTPTPLHVSCGGRGKSPVALARPAGCDRLRLSAAAEGDGQGNRLLLAESRLSKTSN